MIGAYISTHGAFYVPLTAISIYSFHVVGERLDADYSAKIAMLSFILGVHHVSHGSLCALRSTVMSYHGLLAAVMSLM